MSEKTKLALIGEMISNYYEFLSDSSNEKNEGVLECLIACIDAVISSDSGAGECSNGGCRECAGECHNCLE